MKNLNFLPLSCPTGLKGYQQLAYCGHSISILTRAVRPTNGGSLTMQALPRSQEHLLHLDPYQDQVQAFLPPFPSLAREPTKTPLQALKSHKYLSTDYTGPDSSNTSS